MLTQGACINVQIRLNAELLTAVRSGVASPQQLGVMMQSQRSNKLLNSR
jgi:hypothetical protein